MILFISKLMLLISVAVYTLIYTTRFKPQNNMNFHNLWISKNFEVIERHVPNAAIYTKPHLFPNSYKSLYSPKNYNDSGPNLKKILFWNDMFNSLHWGFGYGQEPFIQAGCKVNTCFITSSRKQFPLKDVDALLWHLLSRDRSLPTERFSHTRYIFFTVESAVHVYDNLKNYNGVFNWTMTYRRDSDIPSLYGTFEKLKYPNKDFKENYNYMANKSIMAVWFVSHCKSASGRERLVIQLSKYIEINIYGKCGKSKCSLGQHHDCMKMAEKRYKFYISFENSLCLDYVTEKLYTTMHYNIVPVVYGLGPYESIAPPHSYINAMDFNTAKHLAEYLIYLDNNPDEYNEYFQWKKYYMPLNDWLFGGRAYCAICEMLHNDSLHPNVHHNIADWFINGSKCLTSQDLKIQKLIT